MLSFAQINFSINDCSKHNSASPVNGEFYIPGEAGDPQIPWLKGLVNILVAFTSETWRVFSSQTLKDELD